MERRRSRCCVELLDGAVDIRYFSYWAVSTRPHLNACEFDVELDSTGVERQRLDVEISRGWKLKATRVQW